MILITEWGGHDLLIGVEFDNNEELHVSIGNDRGYYISVWLTKEEVKNLIYLLSDSYNKLVNQSIYKFLLPHKDIAINEGYSRANMQQYKNRKVLRNKDQDNYYSGWMDCYDWLSKNNF